MKAKKCEVKCVFNRDILVGIQDADMIFAWRQRVKEVAAVVNKLRKMQINFTIIIRFFEN